MNASSKMRPWHCDRRARRRRRARTASDRSTDPRAIRSVPRAQVSVGCAFGRHTRPPAPLRASRSARTDPQPASTNRDRGSNRRRAEDSARPAHPRAAARAGSGLVVSRLASITAETAGGGARIPSSIGIGKRHHAHRRVFVARLVARPIRRMREVETHRRRVDVAGRAGLRRKPSFVVAAARSAVCNQRLDLPAAVPLHVGRT